MHTLRFNRVSLAALSPPCLLYTSRLLAQGENSLHAVCASEADWRRDGFGPDAGFLAFVAEDSSGVIGMATCSTRVVTGWNGPVIFLQDLFVEPHCRKHGVASALMARVATLARDVGSPIVELTVRADNPAQNFYAVSYTHLDRQRRIVDQRHAGIDHLAEIMRREMCIRDRPMTTTTPR